MIVQLIIFLVCLGLVIFFCKNFNACVYFIVMCDIFFRVVTYLKMNILRTDAFKFLSYVPNDIPSIIRSFNIGQFEDVFIAIYVIVYIVFEVILIRNFIEKNF